MSLRCNRARPFGPIAAFAVVLSVITVRPAASQVATATTGTTPLTVLFHSDPTTSDVHKDATALKIGDNKFQVMIKDGSGKAVDDADVALLFSKFSRLPQPSATSRARAFGDTTTVPLKHYGDGIYRGESQVAAGLWTIKIAVRRDGHELASRVLTLSTQ